MAKRAAARPHRVESDFFVVTASQVRSRALTKLDPAELGAKVQEFVDRVQEIVKQVRDTASDFQLHEFEVSAEVTAKGSLALLGTGAEAGGTAGLKFVFQRKTASQ